MEEFDTNYINTNKEIINTESIIDSIKSSLNNREYGKALELAKKALSVELNTPEVYLLISQAYVGLQDIENSQRFEKMFKLFEV